MNKEILFRGKNVDNGKWIEGHFVKQYGANVIYLPDGTDNEGFDNHSIVPETVGQYTGLTDSNGVKIFEGDILENLITKCRYYVKYDKPTALFVMVGHDGCHEIFLWLDTEKDFEIIGNIHDNPELLGGGGNSE